MGHSKDRALTPLVKLEASGDSWLGVRITERPSLTCLVMDVGCWRGTLLGLSAAVFLHIPGLSFWSELLHSPMAVFRVSISKTATHTGAVKHFMT